MGLRWDRGALFDGSGGRCRRACLVLILALLLALPCAASPVNATPLDISIACDPLQAQLGESVKIYVAVANPTGQTVQIDQLSLSGAGFEGDLPVQKLIPRRLSPQSSYVAEPMTARLGRAGDLRLTLRVRWSVPSPRGTRHSATFVQGPVVTVRDGDAPSSSSSGTPSGLVLGIGIGAVCVAGFEMLRRTMRGLGERRRVRNLLFVTLGLSLDAIKNEGTIPLEAWETLLLTAGYADQLDALGRWRVKGPPISVQLSELYPRMVAFNKGGRDRWRDEEGPSLGERLEALKETVRSL